MKTMQIAVVTILLAVIQGVAGGASDYPICLEYLAHDTAARPGLNYCLIAGTNGFQVHWDVPGVPKPTFAQLDAILPQALAWKSNQVAEAAADIDKLEIKHVLRALVKTINLRLPSGQKITEEELKAAIKAEVAL